MPNSPLSNYPEGVTEEVINEEMESKNNNFVDDECPHGGDISNDCAGCVDAGEYYYCDDTGDCILRGMVYDRESGQYIREG